MKVFISQPMVDKTDAQILDERNKAIEKIKNTYSDESVEIIDSFIEDAPDNASPLWFLGKSVQFLAEADLAYFIGDWRKYRGCKAENYLAKAYDIPTIEE